MWWHNVKLGLCNYSCVGSTVNETMKGHERKKLNPQQETEAAVRQNWAFHHSATKVVLSFFSPLTISHVSQLLKAEMQRSPSDPSRPSPSLPQWREPEVYSGKSSRAQRKVLFFPTWNGLHAGAARPFYSTRQKPFICRLLKWWKLESV